MLIIQDEYLSNGFNFLRRLRNEEILQEIKVDAFNNEKNGSILITCGDRDRITDIFSHLREMNKLHVLSLNGGGILLSDSYYFRRDVILEDCLDASRIKGSTLIKTLGHFPCGKAFQRGHNAKDIALMILEGKRNLRKALQARIGDLHILPLMHVDWRDSDTPERGLKTYVLQCRDYDTILKIDY